VTRIKIAAISLSASALVGIASWEGFRSTAYIPIPGDVPTIGFGTTHGVKMGDTIDPVKALQRKISDISKFEGALKQCVTVPLHQREYDSYLSLAYNIGPTAFCNSTLVRLLNQGQYEEACKQILRWDRAGGRVVPGLTNRRQAEYKQCIGAD
jgi:lysozyme